VGNRHRFGWQQKFRAHTDFRTADQLSSKRFTSKKRTQVEKKIKVLQISVCGFVRVCRYYLRRWFNIHLEDVGYLGLYVALLFTLDKKFF
jgi:hypothetical protein